jgi:mRNA interferase RelE/StbE
MSDTRNVLLSVRARQAITKQLPKPIAKAAVAFLAGPIAEAPRRVGIQLTGPLFPIYSAKRGGYRVVYTVIGSLVVVHAVSLAESKE